MWRRANYSDADFRAAQLFCADGKTLRNFALTFGFNPDQFRAAFNYWRSRQKKPQAAPSAAAQTPSLPVDDRHAKKAERIAARKREIDAIRMRMGLPPCYGGSHA